MRVHQIISFAAVAVLAGFAGAEGPPTRPAATLKIDGAEVKAVTLSQDEFAKMPHVSVAVTEHNGTKATYSGVPLYNLLLNAGVPVGPDQLRGPKLALYVVAEGADGYKAVIALPEIDPEFTSSSIIVADAREKEGLDAKSGPFKLIVPGDKKQARWVRMLVALHVAEAGG